MPLRLGKEVQALPRAALTAVSMPVNYTAPTPESLSPVAGVVLGTAAAGIKKWTRDDLVLIELAEGARAAGVFTLNRFCAAPVIVCREHLARGGSTRALVINAGNANAGTGEIGIAAARTVCDAAASAVGCAAQEVLPFSTGVIMELLPVDKIVAALPRAHETAVPGGWGTAARAIMTTDTVPKASSRRIDVDGAAVTVTGMAKGAGMCAPKMATMLAFVATDAPIARDVLEPLVKDVAGASFNRVTIDGDTSTNDSFVVVATGRAAMRPIEHASDARLAVLRSGLLGVTQELAQAIVRDAEGATKFIVISVEGGRDAAECERVARAIAGSPLVKTAFFASDANLGRIVCAIGNAGIGDLDPASVSFWLDDVAVVRAGARAASYREDDGSRVMAQPEITVRVALGRGTARSTIWTCDLSHDYVSINADYRT